MKGLRILLGDDHALTLRGIKALLETQFTVVGTATDGRRLVELALSLKPDLVVLDVGLPDMSGFEVCKAIRAQSDMPIIFLTAATAAERVVVSVKGQDYFV